jgi:1-acyl-sn-glycerol-3-phosphate acyltransferase
MIPVDRSINDITSIKTALGYLKNGERVLIFPEGTRAAKHDAGSAKSGAVKLAERAGVPVVPVFIPRRKPFFRKRKIVFGEPYYIEKQTGKRNADDYAKLSEDLMNIIQALDAGSP